MRAFVILCFIAVTYGKPQGYNYNVPNSLGSFGLSGLGIPGNAAAPNFGSAAPSNDPHQTASVAAPTASTSFGASTAPLGVGAPIGTTSTFGNNNGPSAVVAHENAATHQTAVIVSKHFYLHSAAEEHDPEEEAAAVASPVRKNYNIVFIKAPGQGNLGAALAATQQQNEEKTVIYVLNKKQDLSEITQAIDSAGQKPSKPEVFFIKYKTPEEALHAQHEIQAQYNALGGTSEFSDEGLAPIQSFVGSVPSTADNSLGSGSGSQYLPPAY